MTSSSSLFITTTDRLFVPAYPCKYFESESYWRLWGSHFSSHLFPCWELSFTLLPAQVSGSNRYLWVLLGRPNIIITSTFQLFSTISNFHDVKATRPTLFNCRLNLSSKKVSTNSKNEHRIFFFGSEKNFVLMKIAFLVLKDQNEHRTCPTELTSSILGHSSSTDIR